MKAKGIRIVRYADDILIFAPTKQIAGKYMALASNYLENVLKLTVNIKKSHLTNLDKGIKYLGFEVHSDGVYASKKSITKFKEKAECNEVPVYRGKKTNPKIKGEKYSLLHQAESPAKRGS